ncbi:MAG TPA: hypothetical protein VG271_04845 [Beijerinckiaceae bacterium]|nr:hypothetical protein [Beijerinckiaceae bacterium]
MKFDRVGLFALIGALMLFIPDMARAGGTGFGDDETPSGDEGPSFFGFVRQVDGPGIADAKVTADLKNRGALVTRTDIMGVYKIPGFGKDINPDDVTISCAKDGYKQANIQRQPHNAGDNKDPVEVECYLQKN